MSINEEIDEQDELLARPANNTLVTIIIVGIILIATAYVVPKNLREEAERKLKFEEQIVGELNKVALDEKKFKDELKAAAEERQFNLLLYGSIYPPPEVIQQRIERNLKRIAEQNEERKTH